MALCIFTSQKLIKHSLQILTRKWLRYKTSRDSYLTFMFLIKYVIIYTKLLTKTGLKLRKNVDHLFGANFFKRKPMLISSKLKQTVLHDWYLTGSMGNVLKESCNMLLDCLLKFIRFVLNIWSIFIIWGIRWFIFSIEMINWYKSWCQRIIHVSEIRNYNNKLDGTPIFGYTTNTFYYKE